MKDHIQANNLFLVKQIAPFLKPFHKQILVISLSILLIAFLQGVQPYLLKKSIDLYTSSQSQANAKLFWIYPLILFFSLLFLFGLKAWQNAEVQRVGQKFVFNIRSKLFHHLQYLSIDFFESNQVGKLLTRLTSDIEALSETFSSGLIGGANDLFSLIGIVIFMLCIDVKLTFVQLALIPVLILFTKAFETSYRRANSDSRKELSQLNSLFQESLLGLTVIKIFNRENPLGQRFASVNKNYMKANDKLITADSAFSAIIELISIVAIILVVVAVLLLADSMTVGKLVAFVSYSQMLFNPIRSLSEKFSIFQSGFTSAERIITLLDQKSSIESLSRDRFNSNSPQIKTTDSQTYLFPNTSIVFDAVKFKYNSSEESNQVLNGISFNLPEGKSLGIVGQTGSGKSTLIKLLCRFYDPTEGNIFIGGVNLRTIDPYDLRRLVVMVPQRSFLFSGTIRDNLILDKTNISDARLKEIAEETGLMSILDGLEKGFDTELREGGLDLSSGQKQLISLTRALVQEPRILILDEATASLDNHTEAIVTDAIKKIIHSGRTVIFIAHRLSLVTECDNIMALYKGEIRESGTHQELIDQKGYYSHLYELSSLV